MDFDRLWRKTLIDYAFDNVYAKGFARKDIDIGISIFIDEMACDAAGLDELDERIAPFCRVVRRKMLYNGLAVGFHVDGIHKSFYKVYNVRFIRNPGNAATLAV